MNETHRLERMAITGFLAFLESQPDDERWELVEGRPMMMTPPLLGHQRIASNLERAINNALESTRPDLRADRKIGVLVGFDGRYEPEIAVVDEDLSSDVRHIRDFYGIVEVLSSSAERRSASGDTVIDAKVEGYKSCPKNQFVVLVRQDRAHVIVLSRDGANDWTSVVYDDMEATLSLPLTGPVCDLWACYKGTDVARQARIVPKI